MKINLYQKKGIFLVSFYRTNRKSGMENYSEHIQTNRYLYHLTYKKHRDSIDQYGLKANTTMDKPYAVKYENAVFAHNSDLITLDWYPLTMDYNQWDYWGKFDRIISFPEEDGAIADAFSKTYDIWRIDTKRFTAKWFIDEIGERDFKGSFFKKKGLYVVTFESIPREAIEFCKLEFRFIKRTVDKVTIHYTTNIPVPIKLSA